MRNRLHSCLTHTLAFKLLTRICAASALGLTLAAQLITPQAASAAAGVAVAPMTAPEYQFLAMLNGDRTGNGVQAVAANGVLSSLARERSQQLLTSGVFSHYDASGNLVFAALLNNAAFPYRSAGENLAENNYDLSASLGVANNGLMNSPAHRANILNRAFNEVGIGIAGPGPNGQFYYTEIFVQA